jgi:PII-like signaling protein
VPVLTVVIDAPDRVAASFAVVDELTGGHGAVTSEMVPALAGGADGDGLRLARHPY